MKSAYTRQWPWDLIGIGCASLIFSLLTTPASGYFVHADAASQDYIALSWIHNCWEFVSEKMTSLFVLAPLYLVFGAHPFWDTLTLALVAALGLVLVYQMTRELTGTPWAGVLAVLFLAALPAYQFFSRVHIGYVLVFLLAAWLAIRHQHWGWAGFCFAMAIMSHFGATVPVGISGIALMILYLRPERWKQWLSLIIGGLIPILLVDALFFFYTGEVFGWTRATLSVGFRWSGVGALPPAIPSATHLNLTWLLHVLVGSNGWPLTLLLGLALPAPFLLLKKDKVGAAMLASAWLTAFAFAFLAATREGFVSRSLAALYPLWAIGVAVTLYWLLERLVAVQFKRMALIGVVSLLSLFIIQTGLYIRAFTQTPYPQLEQWFQRAITESRPVRYQGLPWIPLYYFIFKGDELLVDDTRWLESGTTGQDVLVFQGEAPVQLSRVGYTISTITLDDGIDAVHPVLTGESVIPRRYEVWWPDGASEPIGRQSFPASMQVASYYSGTGCSTPAPYGGGTLYFYQLVWGKLIKALGG